MIYNHKSEENVQDVILECICPLIEDIADEFDMLRRYDALHLYLPSWLAREIVGRILDEIEGLWVHEEAHTELLCKDDNEVIITIAYDGMVFIEEARGTKGQLKDGDGVVNYVYDGFKQKDIEKLVSDDCPVLVFGFEEDEIEDDTLVEYSDDKDGDTHGFTASRSDENGYYSYSFYTSEKLDKNDIQKMLKDMGF